METRVSSSPLLSYETAFVDNEVTMNRIAFRMTVVIFPIIHIDKRTKIKQPNNAQYWSINMSFYFVFMLFKNLIRACSWTAYL